MKNFESKNPVCIKETGNIKYAPEEDPGLCLFESEDISSVAPDTAHLSKGAVTANEPAFLDRKRSS